MPVENNNFYHNVPQERNDFPPRRRKSRFFFWLVIAFLILGIVFLASIALAYKFYSTSQKVIENQPPQSFAESLRQIASSDHMPLRADSDGRINILLLGLAGDNYPGGNLTDSIIIASINPKTYKTALLSIPRDLYVQIPDTDSYTKINALYARGKDQSGRPIEGIKDLKKALTVITGLPIHYHIAIDFDGFKKIIGELGGIKIQVQKDLHDERYPGPNFSYETFDIKKGLCALDGETALKFARTRHDEDGDFGRSFRQQQILESTRQKAFSLETLVNIPAVNNILNILGDHLRTDIPLAELESFLDLAKKIDTHNTINKVLEAGKSDSLMAVSHVMLGNVRAFVLIPRTGNYDEIQDLAKNIFDLDLITRKKKEIENENASVAVVNSSGKTNFDRKLGTLLTKLGYQVKSAASSQDKNASVAGDTVIYDLTNGLKPFSLEDLLKKMSAKIATSLPPNLSVPCQKADFCLAAGENITDSLNYEENSVTDLEQGYDKQTTDEKTYIDLLKKGSSQKF